MESVTSILLIGVVLCIALIGRGVYVIHRNKALHRQKTEARALRQAEMMQQSTVDADIPPPPLPQPEVNEGVVIDDEHPEPPLANHPVIDVAGIVEEVERQLRLGQLEDAAKVLQKAINRAPRETELRLKLLEIHLANENEAGITQQEMDIEAIGDESAMAYCQELLAAHRYPTASNGD